jgi:hypothetical protein
LQSTSTPSDRAGYAERVRAAAQQLVTARFLLGGDVQHAVDDAMRLFDEAQGPDR